MRTPPACAGFWGNPLARPQIEYYPGEGVFPPCKLPSNSLPNRSCPGAPTFCRTESRQRFAKEAFPLFGISPSGSSLHSIGEGWKKVENRKLSQLFYATDAILAFVFVNKSSAVTREFIKGGGWPPPLSFLKVSGVSKGREENRNPLSPLWPLGTFRQWKVPPPGRAWGGNWMTIHMDGNTLNSFDAKLEKLHF